MKITGPTLTPSEFKPISFTITIESQQELDAWGKLMNSGSFDSAMRELGLTLGGASYIPFEDAGADVNRADATLRPLFQKHFK